MGHSILLRCLKDPVDFNHGEESGFCMVADLSGPLKVFQVGIHMAVKSPRQSCVYAWGPS